MDLIHTLGALHRALSFFHGNEQPAPQKQWADWETDDAAFERHFGMPFAAFEEIVQHLSEEQAQLLEDTLQVNPEAAVLWILSMEEIPAP